MLGVEQKEPTYPIALIIPSNVSCWSCMTQKIVDLPHSGGSSGSCICPELLYYSPYKHVEAPDERAYYRAEKGK